MDPHSTQEDRQKLKKGYGISNKIKVHKFKESVQVKLSEVLFF
jgi:hypothetical protein